MCHGAAGNGCALLTLWGATGDDVWLERARLFSAFLDTELYGIEGKKENEGGGGLFAAVFVVVSHSIIDATSCSVEANHIPGDRPVSLFEGRLGLVWFVGDCGAMLRLCDGVLVALRER